MKCSLGMLYAVVWLLGSGLCRAGELAALPGTEPLQTSADLTAQIVGEAHQFLDRKTTESVAARAKYWRRDLSSPAAYEKSVAPNRQRFMKYIGMIDPRVPVVMERFGDEENPALVAETDRYRVYQVRWPVLEGVEGEGLLLEPKGPAVAHVVALPDADQTPEQLVGLAPGVAADSQFARRLAENGYRVVVPALVDRTCRFSGNPRIAMTNQPHREWIYRQAYEMGRHVIGYEVQKILSVVDWFEKTASTQKGDSPIFAARKSGQSPVAVAGYGEGGLLAFYAAAADPRIDVCLVSGYFDSRQQVWQEPIYRNVWGLLEEFGDAEIASLIVPRTLLIEYSPVPKIDGPPAAEAGRRGGAAPGKLATPPLESVLAEVKRANDLDQGRLGMRHVIHGPDNQPVGPGAAKTLKALAGDFGAPSDMSLSESLPKDRRTSFDPVARQRRQVGQLTGHVQVMLRRSDQVRDDFLWNKASVKTADEFAAAMKPYRQIFWNELIGPMDDPLVEPKPKSRKIYDQPKWTGYDVVLDVWPELHAWGILLVPKDLKPGEKRPVVVCQHGLEGQPKDTIDADPECARYYISYAAKLAEQGFIVFSPYNLYRGEDRFRTLQRKANPLKASLFSIIIRQHEQILKWLGSLPEVDPSRIAFYGLSYGGKSAMRIPAALPGYCLSICSGDFDDWNRKNVTTEAKYSYVFYGEWEMFEFDLGNTFNYAEMSALIFPRPFMIERGHHDAVAPDCWVGYEYAKVRYLYDNLGLGDRTEIEWFNGPHMIHGVGTFEFLHKHLNWPKK